MFKHSSDVDILTPITNYMVDNAASQPLAPIACLNVSTKLRKEVSSLYYPYKLSSFLHKKKSNYQRSLIL